MSQVKFDEFIIGNSRDTHKVSKEQAAMHVNYIEMFYTEKHYNRKKYPKAPFTYAAVNKSYLKFRGTKGWSTGNSPNMIRTARMVNTTYIFTWIAKKSRGIAGKKAINQASRKHIPDHILKYMGEKPKKGTAQLIGAHIEASAFMQLLRKGMQPDSKGRTVITEEEAQAYLNAFLEGDLEKALTTTSADTSREVAKNVQTVQTEEELGMTYEEYKDISKSRNQSRLNVESMTPMPAGVNKSMEEGFERAAIKGMKAELNNIADKKGIEYIEVDGSLSSVGMWQEIIAASLLGKTVPKYRTRKALKRGGKKTKKTSRNVKTPKGTKGKRATSQVEKAKFRTQLRNAGGQYASPTALRALLNKKLPNKLIENMGQPSLENITGRFAQSARVVNITHGKNIKVPTIQYTYDTDPYQVFEMGGKGDSRWATQARDPRFIIDNTIREIAAEMMITKFNTQRL